MTTKPTIAYDYSLAESPATTTAKNHVSLFNPVGSGKLVVVGGFFISFTMTEVATNTAPMRGFRTTAASGGTLVSASAVCKFSTLHADPVAEIRIDNPTVTLGSAIFSSPPGVDKRSSTAHQVDVPPGAGRFILRPGEGVVLRQGVSVAGLFWNLSMVWAEI